MIKTKLENEFIPSTLRNSLPSFMSSYLVNLVWHTKGLPLAALAHKSLLSIKPDVLKLVVAQELKLALKLHILGWSNVID